MTTQSDSLNTKMDSGMRLVATWLWIVAGTISVGLILPGIVNTAKLGYYQSGLVLAFGFILGGVIGGVITRFLPWVIKWQRTGWILSLVLPVILMSPIVIKIQLHESILGVCLVLLGVLGSSYVVWIPRLIKSLRGKFQSTGWVVLVAMLLIMMNTFFLLFLTICMLGQ